jgi:Holliday junction resolvasome RuvABC endonuclease subunit
VAWVRPDGSCGVETKSFRDDVREGERLNHIFVETYGLLTRLHFASPAGFVWVEQPFAFGKPVPPVSYMVMGAIMVAAVRATSAVVEAQRSPGAWKRLALGAGFGNAKKPQIVAWARAECGYAGALEDEADALGIAVAASRAVVFEPSVLAR